MYIYIYTQKYVYIYIYTCMCIHDVPRAVGPILRGLSSLFHRHHPRPDSNGAERGVEQCQIAVILLLCYMYDVILYCIIDSPLTIVNIIISVFFLMFMFIFVYVSNCVFFRCIYTYAYGLLYT